MKRVVVGAAVLALGAGGIGFAQAQAPTGYKVNGGGQILVDPEASGPGDTIGFVAQQTGTGEDDYTARGQWQYIDREDGKQVSNQHGEVRCLLVDGDRAVVVGQITRNATDSERFFRMDIWDNKSAGQGNDVVVVSKHQEQPECDEVSSDDEPLLARGNVTIHEPKGGEE